MHPCPYCSRAVSLLKKKNADFDEIKAGMDADKRAEMIQRSNGGRTFPQIFIGDQHICGCDEMMALDQRGQL
ncbi:MAG: glutaredoxin 3, partial [Pseudomonadota bacterium]